MSVVNMGDMMCLGKIAPEGWSWIKTDKKRIRKEVKGFRDPETLVISETIDRTIDILVMQFQNITNLSILRYKA